MGEIRDFIWAFPFTGSILILIAFLTPAAYKEILTNSIYVWIWGLVSSEYYDYESERYINETIISSNPDIFFPSLGVSIVIILCFFILFATSVINRKTITTRVANIWLFSSIFVIFSTILWMIIMHLVMQDPELPNFWNFYNAGFGIIGMFLGAALSIVGFVIAKTIEKTEKQVITPPPKELIKIDSSIEVKFCPNCGEKVQNENQHFCMKCGFKIKSG